MSNQVSAPARVCRHDGRLSHTRLMEQAKVVLIDWFELAPADAEALLRSWASECGVPACELAEGLTLGVCQGRATGCSLAVVRQLEELLRRLPAVTAGGGTVRVGG
jgi:hypothetical protein